jgi:hypothetical protein
MGGRVKNSLIYSILLLLLFSGCGLMKKQPITREQEVDIALDYLLANIRSNLMASNDFLGRNTSSFQQVPWSNKESFEKFRKLAQDGLNGEAVYRELKKFYREQIGGQRILEAYHLFQRPDVVALMNKERSDLGPDNFQRFEDKWRELNQNDHDARFKIYENFDQIAKISEGNILIARWVGEGLIDLIQHLGVSTIHIKRWRDNAKESINFFELQTRFFTAEVMRYSYQDFTLEELMQLEDVLGRPEVEAFYGLTAQALEYAYRQSIQRVIAQNGPINSTRQSQMPEIIK